MNIDLLAFSSTGFNWYGTEKLIKKYLSSRGIPTYIYYYKRNDSDTNEKRSYEHKNESLLENLESCRGRRIRFDVSEEKGRLKRLKVHLPNYFQDVHVFFHDIDSPTVKRLKRFLYAYVSNLEA